MRNTSEENEKYIRRKGEIYEEHERNTCEVIAKYIRKEEINEEHMRNTCKVIEKYISATAHPD